MKKISHHRRRLNLLQLVGFSTFRTELALLVRACAGDLVAANAAINLLNWLPSATRPDGYIYKSESDWLAEVGIDARRIRRAYAILKKLGFEIEVLPHAHGRATHYRLNLRRFCKALATVLAVAPLKIFALLTGKQLDPSSHNGVRGQTKIAPSTTRNTTNTTQTTVVVAEQALPLFQNPEGQEQLNDDHPTTSAPAYERLKALGVSGRALIQFSATPLSELERALSYVRQRNPRNIAGMLVECLRAGWHATTTHSLAPTWALAEPSPSAPNITEQATEPDFQSFPLPDDAPAPTPTHQRIWLQAVSQLLPRYRLGEAGFLRRDPLTYDASTHTYTLTVSAYNSIAQRLHPALTSALSAVAHAFGQPAPTLIISQSPVQEVSYA
jgi:hypothetical protein